MWLNQGHWVFFGFLCEEHEDFPFGFLGYQTLNEDENFLGFPFNFLGYQIQSGENLRGFFLMIYSATKHNH